MNTFNPRIESLPLPLPQANPAGGAPDGLRLADAALLAFNFELQDLRDDAPSVDAAQIAGLARWLQALPAETAAATIELRLARAESLRRMIDDRDWALPEDVAIRGRRLVAYIHRCHDLIPDDLPQLGHLDDALLVELSWSEFEGEVQDYLDYRRWCSRDPMRGNAQERRIAWEADCLAEAGAILHRQEVRERGYSRPEPLSRPFRVC
jgi:uncharacterized membrane protein YkvA (DUF1232 family)